MLNKPEYVVKEARFVLSSPTLKLCPKDDLPEFAFIGRSNVGKSSLINMLAQHKGLALTSSTPGKTKLINFFIINNAWYMVDLPGYGYAKVSKSKRGEFQEIIVEYIGKRKNLYCVFVLVDSRIPPQESDIRFINWLGQSEIPFKIIFTKTDKISPTELNSKLDTYQNTLKEFWAELPEIIITSAIKKTGSKEIFDVITQAMGL